MLALWKKLAADRSPEEPGDAAAESVVGHQPWQRCLAEAIGTFLIVFIGCGAAITDARSHGAVTLLGIAMAFGFTVAAMIYTLGPISAAHFNPAVTLGFSLGRRFPWSYVPAYIGSQLIGALLASTVHALVFPRDALQRAQFGATAPNVGPLAAFVLEVVLTFFLMLVVMAVATDKRVSATVPGLAIGLTVVAAALFGGPITGASMNPVRSLAPALFAGGAPWHWLWIYLLGPICGAALAVGCFEALRDGPAFAQAAPADLEEALWLKPGLSRRR